MTHRILVVEDEPSIADNIVFALKKDGFNVDSNQTIQEAETALFSGQKYDLVVLDVGLPDGNGFDFCKVIRKKSNIPIVFLTARNDEIDRVVGFEIGADDYIVKPFSLRELIGRIKAILRRVQPDDIGSDKAIQPSFVVDEDKYEIQYYGSTLELSRYEFHILKLLIKNQGRVFTRSHLMDAVWTDSQSSFDRTVDTHIKTIRSKLKKVKSEEDPIKTHRGIGYSLKEFQ